MTSLEFFHISSGDYVGVLAGSFHVKLTRGGVHRLVTDWSNLVSNDSVVHDNKIFQILYVNSNPFSRYRIFKKTRAFCPNKI